MAKVGRNDPCPCGSGLKYKKCCLLKETEAEPYQQRVISRAEERLRDKLSEFATSGRFSEDVQKAFGLFWKGKYTYRGEEKPEPEEATKFLDWYIYSSRLSEWNKPPVVVFLETRGYTLDRDELAILKEWQTTQLGVFEVTAVEADKSISLRELYSGETHDVADSSAASRFAAGDLAVTRVMRVGGKPVLSGTLTRLAPDARENIARWAVDEYNKWLQPETEDRTQPQEDSAQLSQQAEAGESVAPPFAPEPSKWRQFLAEQLPSLFRYLQDVESLKAEVGSEPVPATAAPAEGSAEPASEPSAEAHAEVEQSSQPSDS